MAFPVCVVILDKSEATCIRHVEWKDTGTMEAKLAAQAATVAGPLRNAIPY